jgi:hypothetical protein
MAQLQPALFGGARGAGQAEGPARLGPTDVYGDLIVRGGSIIAEGDILTNANISANDVDVNRAKVEVSISCRGNVSGKTGLRYNMITLGSAAAPPVYNFEGSTFFINPYLAGDGAATIVLDLVALLFLLADGLPIFKFVNTSLDAQTVTVRITNFPQPPVTLVVPTEGGRITELIYSTGIGAPNNLMYWSYGLLGNGVLGSGPASYKL